MINLIVNEILSDYYGNTKQEKLEDIVRRKAGEHDVEYSYVLGFVRDEIFQMNG